MGFLSSIGGFLNGSPSKSQESSQSGFALLPSEIQNTFKNFATAANNQIPNLTQAYTPMPLTQGENTALGNLTQGFAPTAESLSRDIGMFMNPYQQYVVDPINRQAQGDFSILKQAQSQAGQLGSNRGLLGANDIENTRQTTIGNVLKGGYDTALQSVLANLIPQRQQDAQNALGAGQYQRDIYNQTQQAPIAGLQNLSQALGILPTSGGSTSQGTSTGATKGLVDWFS